MKPSNSVKSSSTCLVAGIHVAIVRTFSLSEEKVTEFSGFTLAFGDRRCNRHRAGHLHVIDDLHAWSDAQIRTFLTFKTCRASGVMPGVRSICSTPLVDAPTGFNVSLPAEPDW